MIDPGNEEFQSEEDVRSTSERKRRGHLRESSRLDQVRRMAGVIGRFEPDIRPQRSRLVLAALATIGYVLMGLLEPWPLKLLFDNVLAGVDITFWPWTTVAPISSGTGAAIVLIVAAFLLVAFFRALFDYIVNRLSALAGQGIAATLRSRTFNHLQSLSLGYHDRRQTGELMTRMTTDISLMRELLVDTIITFVSSVLVLVGMTAVMIWLDWKLTLVALASAPLLLWSSGRYIARIKDAVRAQRRQEGGLASSLHETLSLIKVVQIFQRESFERDRFEVGNEASAAHGVRAANMQAELRISTDLILAIGSAGVLLVGAYQVTAGALTMGELLIFTAYLRQMYRPLRDLARLTERFSKIGACGERLLDLLDTEPEVHDLPGAIDIGRAAGAVEFEHVRFKYRHGPTIFSDLNLTVRPGERVALVGTTGAGKSTILSLLPRLYDVRKGVVRVDGHDIRSLTLRSLREQFSIVPQDSVLFSSSIRDNIAYGRLDATMADIEAAAREANIHDHIASLPDGYDTLVGERGATLSGGQRQRVAIARAMLRDAPILLLDEPTTGLDAKTEEVVMDALNRLMRGRTTIMVTHRLPLIQTADKIVVIEHGKIMESGTHAELIRLGGRYSALFEIQSLPSSEAGDGREPVVSAPALGQIGA